MIVKFKPVILPVITKWVAEKILKSGDGELEVSLDLGLSKAKVTISSGSVSLPTGDVISLKVLEKLEEGDVYIVRENEIFKAEFFAEGKYYRLFAPYPEDAPTLEISGIRMHRTEEVTPWEDAKMKVVSIKVFPNASVLDIGTGLGYTAIWSINFGASSIMTIEKDQNVLKMAEINPWSRKLADTRITILLGDASELIEKFDDCLFDRVINDPPRFALAGELYSQEFYYEIFRVLKPKGWLYHYVGEPGKRRRKDIPAGVIKRLKECGFEKIRRQDVGIVARKPAGV